MCSRIEDEKFHTYTITTDCCLYLDLCCEVSLSLEPTQREMLIGQEILSDYKTCPEEFLPKSFNCFYFMCQLLFTLLLDYTRKEFIQNIAETIEYRLPLLLSI